MGPQSEIPQSEIGWQTAPGSWSCGGKGPISKTAARPTDQCSSVGKTQLSDTGVGDELLTVIGQLTRGVAEGTYLTNVPQLLGEAGLIPDT